MDRLDDAISSNSVDDLQELWEYIKSRQSRLKTDISEDERKTLDNFIESKRKCGIFILSKGALEAYLPNGYKGKDVEKLIRLTSNLSFIQSLPAEGLSELMLIAENIRL